MSYGIMVPRGGQTHLITYRTTRPANLLYFDGMSAAWGEGWLDSQHMFIFGMSKNGSKDIGWWDDYGRAEKLCEWAKFRAIDGFVRMNAGFEIVWCDFQSPALQLVSHLNITPPGTPESTPFPFPRSPRRDLIPMELDSQASPDFLEDPPEGPPRREPGGGGDGPPRRGPGRDGPGRWRPRMSDLALTGTLEWVRAASHRSFSPQPHLTLLYWGMVTYYHPRLTSLLADRIGRPMHSHSLVNISSQDARSVVDEVDEVLARVEAGDRGSDMDWGTTARDIVEYWGDRISHMHAYLLNASDPSANATAALPAIRTLAYTLLNPYMQPGLTPNASGWDLFFGVPSALVPDAFAFDTTTTALERCTYQATGFLSQLHTTRMTPQEILLQTSMESVLGRLCNDFGVIFAQSSDLVGDSGTDPRSSIQRWTRKIHDLMQWLDWTVWLRCEDVCPRDYVCSTPMWPIAWFRRPGEQDSDGLEFLKPRCMRMAVGPRL
ncbi:hypothetical protein B0H17DRAFT_142379 [Mycena rosella]|uniref:Uncharacterized protein n=1 Tax=Mycena rosella TaxID=1033263 RepID=A0AAD7GMR2_MYCRO|nr:hypothetical protein B0H17DRAFT_142379 [Mycena rosella]